MTFVTGGTGVLGAHLLLKLLEEGKTVKALCRPSSKKEIVKQVFSYYTNEAETLFSKITWHEGDILDFENLASGIAGCEEVYHTAAIVSFDPGRSKEMKFLNRQGTANVVNVCLEQGVKKLCHVSSVAALGDPKNGEAVDETSERSKSVRHSAYSESKYISEMEVWRGVAEGLNAVVVNPSIILAPGDWGRSSTKLFPSVWKGFRFHTPGSAGYVDVIDVVEIMLDLMAQEKFGQRYLLNSESLGYYDVFASISTALNKPAPNIKVPKKVLQLIEKIIRLKTVLFGGEAIVTKDTIQSAYSLSNYSNKKIKEELNYTFTPVRESIQKVSGFFLHDINAK